MAEFMVRRYAAWLREWEETLCDECVEEREITERFSNQEVFQYEDDEGQGYYWIEDKDSRYGTEDTCDECGESRESQRRFKLVWTNDDGEEEVIEDEIEGEGEAYYLQGEYALAYGGNVRIEEED